MAKPLTIETHAKAVIDDLHLVVADQADKIRVLTLALHWIRDHPDEDRTEVIDYALKRIERTNAGRRET